MKSIFPTKPKSKLTSTTFKVHEEVISNKENMANGFGHFFCSIVTTLLQSLHLIKDFLWNKPKNLPIQKIQKFSFRSVTPSGIYKSLKKIPHKKAHRINEFPTNLPKDVANEISKLPSYGISGNKFTWFENYLIRSSMYSMMVTYQKQS